MGGTRSFRSIESAQRSAHHAPPRTSVLNTLATYRPTTLADMDETEALEALSNLLTDLSANPYDISLHARHIGLASATSMEDQEHLAREMMVTYWATGDEVWLPLIEAKEKTVDLGSREGVQEVLDLYNKAEDDYLCASFTFRLLWLCSFVF